MRILLTNTFYYPNVVGGAEYSTKLLAEGLAKQKNEVAVYSVDSFEKELKKEEIEGVLVYRGTGGRFDAKLRFTKKGPVFKKFLNKFYELRNVKAEKEFERIIKEFKPDVIHTNNINGMSPLVWKCAKKNNIPCVHTIRDYWIVSPKNVLPKRNNFIELIYQKYFRKYSKYVDYVTAPSEFTLNSVLNLKYFDVKNSKHVNNSVDLDMDYTRKCISNRKNNNDEKVNFIFVGSLFENKGIFNLIKAFTSIKNDNISLSICGKGKLEEYVIESAKKDKRITYRGMLTKEELQNEWIKNDVLIVPSVWDEPFGRVVIEANQHGLPVIGSNKGGILEILEYTKTGITYQFDDIEELKKAIKYFSNRNNVKKYYDEIMEKLPEYSIEKQLKAYIYIYIYLQLLQKNKGEIKRIISKGKYNLFNIIQRKIICEY